MPTYSLPELANLADVTPRTVRFYIAQGLLPAPESLGPKAHYTDEHLGRLLAIKKLQAAHLPLAQIRAQLRASSPDELATFAASDRSTPQAGSAVDYIRSVLGRPQAAESAPSYPAPQAPPPPPPPAAHPEPLTTRSQWERISLDADIELHIRRPLTRQNNKRVERLIAIARELFEED